MAASLAVEVAVVDYIEFHVQWQSLVLYVCPDRIDQFFYHMLGVNIYMFITKNIADCFVGGNKFLN